VCNINCVCGLLILLVSAFDSGGVARGLEIYIPFPPYICCAFVDVLLRVISDASSYVCVYLYFYMCVCVCVSIYVCVYVYLYMYIYLFVYIPVHL
jgi:hypothetical protein